MTKLLTGAGVDVGVFTPLSLPGLSAWWRADTLALSDGDAVASWADSLGLAGTFVQASVSKKPTYKTGIVNGKPVVRFDGIDDWMQIAAATFNSDRGLVIVHMNQTDPNAPCVPFSSSDATGNRYLEMPFVYLNKTNSFQNNNDVGDFITGNTTVSAGWHTVQAGSTGTAYLQSLDGVAQTLTVGSGANNGDWFSDTSSRNSVTLGARGAPTAVPDLFFAGDLTDLIVVEGVAPTAGDLLDVARYFNRIYGTATA